MCLASPAVAWVSAWVCQLLREKEKGDCLLHEVVSLFMWNYVDERGAEHIVHHGGDAETELMELELGWRAAFDLFHLDDVMFKGYEWGIL